ncbi:MAG: sulfotransferase domain-containing protein [Terriglobales bacterium]
MTDQSNNSGNGSKPRKPTTAMRKVRRKLSRTILRVPIIWYRHHGFRPEDVFFASYPRSGTTWSRHTLFEILTERQSGFRAVDSTLCGVGKHHDGGRVLPGGGRLISTHEQYRREYKKVIYLTRDCRDVVLSEFTYLRNLEFFHGDLDAFVKHFVTTRVSGFGPWQRHIASWLDSPLIGTPNILVMRFEDLRQNPVEEFTRMANFLGVNPGAETIQRAVANSSLEKMQEKERREPVKASVKGRFVNSGAVRGWRSKLTPAQVTLIESYAGSALKRLGHPLSTEVSDLKPSPDTSHQISAVLSSSR